MRSETMQGANSIIYCMPVLLVIVFTLALLYDTIIRSIKITVNSIYMYGGL